MRQRTIKNIADRLFWLVVALLPILIYIGTFISYRLTTVTDTLPTFAEFMANFGVSQTSIVYTSIADLFGANGILPLFANNNAILLYMAYFVSIEIVHLAVDFLVFIPRLAHKWMEKLTINE